MNLPDDLKNLHSEAPTETVVIAVCFASFVVLAWIDIAPWVVSLLKAL